MVTEPLLVEIWVKSTFKKGRTKIYYTTFKKGRTKIYYTTFKKGRTKIYYTTFKKGRFRKEKLKKQKYIFKKK